MASSRSGKKRTSGKPAPGKAAAKKAAKLSPSGRAKAKSAKATPAKAKSVKTSRALAVKPAVRKAPSGNSSGEKKTSRAKLTPRQKEILEIRRTLVEQKDSILSEAESTMNSLPEQTVFPDLGDQATAESDRNFILRLRSREQRLLTKIEEAVERIDGGIFGICDVCGEEIGLERLRARPVATLCIHCKEEQEEEEKLQGL